MNDDAPEYIEPPLIPKSYIDEMLRVVGNPAVINLPTEAIRRFQEQYRSGEEWGADVQRIKINISYEALMAAPKWTMHFTRPPGGTVLRKKRLRKKRAKYEAKMAKIRECAMRHFHRRMKEIEEEAVFGKGYPQRKGEP